MKNGKKSKQRNNYSGFETINYSWNKRLSAFVLCVFAV